MNNNFCEFHQQYKKHCKEWQDENMLGSCIDPRLLKRPKYKIGDVIVYLDPYQERKWEDDRKRHPDIDRVQDIIQSKVVESSSSLDLDDKDDEGGWFYLTEHSIKEEWDSIQEEDILYGL